MKRQLVGSTVPMQGATMDHPGLVRAWAIGEAEMAPSEDLPEIREWVWTPAGNEGNAP